MNGNNDFIQIGIDYSGADEDKHCAVLNLYYNDTSHLIYETFDKEQIKALDNVLQNTFEQQRKVMALEIIKEKCLTNCNLALVKDNLHYQNYCNEFEYFLNKYNESPNGFEITKEDLLTEEEFNLLKEILE